MNHFPHSSGRTFCFTLIHLLGMVSERPEPWSQRTVNNSKTLNNYSSLSFRSLACMVGMIILSYRGAVRNKWESIGIFKDYQSVGNRRDYKAGSWVHHPMTFSIHMIPEGNLSALQGLAKDHILLSGHRDQCNLDHMVHCLAKQPGWWVQGWPTNLHRPFLVSPQNAHRMFHLIHSGPTKWI